MTKYHQRGILDFTSSSHHTTKTNNNLPCRNSIPHLSLLSHNVTSLGEYSGVKFLGPQAKIYRGFDIFGLQETKLARNASHSALERFLPSHDLFLGNNPANHGTTPTHFTAGVLIGVEKHLHADFLISCPAVPHALQGHAIAIVGKSIARNGRSFIVCNIRYHTKDRLVEQEEQAKDIHAWLSLLATPHNPIVYIMGDFNFVDSQEDTTSNLNPSPRPNHSKLLEDFNLREVAQPCHTYYFKSADPAVIPRSARLDRIYSNLTEADFTVTMPLAYLPCNSIIGKEKFNEHLPVAIRFSGPRKANSSFRLPDSTINNPNFVTTFLHVWKKMNVIGLSPFEKMSKFKKALKKTHFLIRSSNDKNALGLFVAAVRLLTVLSHRNPTSAAYLDILQSYPALGSYITKTQGVWDLSLLRDYVNRRFVEDGAPVPSALPGGWTIDDREALAATPSIPFKAKISNVLADIKLILPSSQSTVRMLRPDQDSEPSDDPDQLGDIIHAHYGALWEKEEKNNDAFTADYLSDYDKIIDASLINKPSLELIARAVVNAPNSSRGPDGIPFSAYKALSDVANPLLLECALTLQDSELPLKDFNRSRLTLLPKKSTLLVNDTRPICVNNTDNRIIAKTLVLCISEAAQSLIGNYQKMFLPGRQMLDHLLSLNEEFYGDWRSQKQRYVLFTDNRKAFDSIRHGFIFSVLHRLCFPPWFINSVRSLLTDATAFSGLAPNKEIAIRRGVKQGCPLSPLLFLLAYDPLIYRLQKTRASVRAAADDLALSSNSLEDLICCFSHIDDFTTASGMGINVDKTKILSTIAHPCPYEAAQAAHKSSLSAESAASAAAASFESALSACASFADSPAAMPHTYPGLRRRFRGKVITPSKRTCTQASPPPPPPAPPPDPISDSSQPLTSSSSRKRRRQRAIFTRTKKRKKTLIVDGRPLPEALPPPPPRPLISPHTLLRNSIWPEVRVVEVYVYLGVPLGPSVTPDMVYEKAMGKIRSKFRLLGPTLKKMSVQKRIITVNVFILSLLSYVNQLVRLPDAAYKELRQLIHKHTTPWNGTAWGYNFLVAPPCNGGFPTPIQDPWVNNVLALLRRVDWSSVNISSISWEPKSVDSHDPYTDGIWEDSVRISDNVNLAIVDFLGPLYFNWDKVSSLSELTKATIKNSLIKKGFLSYPAGKKHELTLSWGRDFDDHLSAKLAHFGVANFADDLKKHYRKPVRNSFLYENHLKIVTNSLATSRRRRFLSKAVSNPLPVCHLCRTADDGVRHLFFDCTVVKAAIKAVSRSNMLVIPDATRVALANQRPLFLPVSPSLTTGSFNPLSLCMAFCRAVTDATSRAELGMVICPSFISNATIKYFMPARTRMSRLFGNASSRTPEQKKSANDYAHSIISKIPAKATIIYTDGSAIPNPGPAGAGCLIQHPTHLRLPPVHLYASIGHGTNNLGEAWAIGMGLTHFFANHPSDTCVILTDSELCIRALENGFSNHPPLNRLIQLILSLLRDNPDCYVKYFWVPGHVDVAGNEAADRLANLGAKSNNGATSSPRPFSYRTISTINFPPISNHT